MGSRVATRPSGTDLGDWDSFTRRHLRLSRAVFGLTTLGLVTASLGAQAEGIWSTGPPLQLARQEIDAVTLDGTTWVAGGVTGEFSPVATDAVEKLAPGATAWSWGPPLPAPRDHAAMAVHGGRIWILGGFDIVGIPQPTVWSIAPGESLWFVETSLPEPRAAGSAATIDGRLVYVGGQDLDHGGVGDLWLLSSDETLWEPGPNLPTPRHHMAAAVVGGRLYTFGGRGPSGPTLDEVEAWDPITGWKKVSPLPTPRSGLAGSAVGGLVWLGGGENPGIFPTVERYNPSDDSWADGPSLSTPRHGMGSTVDGESWVIVGGGNEPFFSPSDIVEVFLPNALFLDGFETGDLSAWN